MLENQDHDRHELEVETDNRTIKSHQLQVSQALFAGFREDNPAEADKLYAQYRRFMYQNLVGASSTSRGARFGIEELIKDVCPDYKQKRKNDKTLNILRSIAKVFLEEIIEESVVVKQQSGKKEVDPDSVREAFRRYDLRKGIKAGGNSPFFI